MRGGPAAPFPPWPKPVLLLLLLLLLLLFSRTRPQGEFWSELVSHARERAHHPPA